jgi:NAD/NADP transhydrogenase beta subunit
MEGFSFVTPVTGLSRPNTGKEGDETGLAGVEPSVILTHFGLPYFTYIIALMLILYTKICFNTTFNMRVIPEVMHKVM